MRPSSRRNVRRPLKWVRHWHGQQLAEFVDNMGVCRIDPRDDDGQ